MFSNFTAPDCWRMAHELLWEGLQGHRRGKVGAALLMTLVGTDLSLKYCLQSTV